MAPFDRTYEGLKRLHPVICRGIPRAFDRTYEGLKPRLPLLSGEMATTSFDRTYEGLKRCGEVYHCPHLPRF